MRADGIGGQAGGAGGARTIQFRTQTPLEERVPPGAGKKSFALRYIDAI